MTLRLDAPHRAIPWVHTYLMERPTGHLKIEY